MSKLHPSILRPSRARCPLVALLDRMHELRTREVRAMHHAAIEARWIRHSKVREFWQMYRLYRRAAHGRIYSAQMALEAIK